MARPPRKPWSTRTWGLLAALALLAVIGPLAVWFGVLALACATGGGCV